MTSDFTKKARELLKGATKDLPWVASEWRPRGGYKRVGIGNKDGSGNITFSVGLDMRNAALLAFAVNNLDALTAVVEAAEELYDVTQTNRRDNLTEREFAELEERAGDAMAEALDALKEQADA